MLKTAICYLIIYIVWGSTYLFIRIAVQELSPLFVVGSRFLIGGILLCLYCQIRGYYKTPPSLVQLKNSLIIGTLLLAGGNGLVTYAQKDVSSYFSALLVASTPIAVLLFDRLLFKKKIPFTGWSGAALGLIGVSILLMKGDGSLSLQLNPQIFLILSAVVFWALGTSLSKQLEMPQNSVVNASIQLLFVGLVVSIYSAYSDSVSVEFLKLTSFKAIASVAYLALFGTIALGAYSHLLYNEPARRIVSYALINPLIAVVLGIAVAKETRVPFLVPGAALILSGLVLMFYGPVFFNRSQKK